MTEKLFVTMCEYAIGITVAVALIIILLTSWYDFRLALIKKRTQQASDKLTKSRQPFITIVIYTQNHASSITRCLDSITKSRYTNYRIVVADHKSTDTTRQIAKAFAASHPKQSIKLYNARDTLSRNEVIQRAIKKVPASDYSMIIDGSVEITENALRSAMANFLINENLDHLVLRNYSNAELSMRSLVPHFFGLTKNTIYKALSAVGFLRPTDSAVSITKQNTHNGPHTYASDITYHQDKALVRSKPSIIRLLLTLIICILFIPLVGYWMWTAATLRSNLLLTLSWIVLSISLLAVIWSDSLVKINQKIELTVTVPFMYFFLYVHAVGSLFKTLWLLIRRYPYQKQINAFKAELHSTRY
jgi:glycosyltransferase involved in cell wall biosynthesis